MLLGFELLTLTRFIVIVAIAAVWMLLGTEQGQDLLAAMRESGDVPHAFLTALFTFAITAWYWGQKSLVPFQARLSALAPRSRCCMNFALWMQDWYPRFLGAAPMIPIALCEFSAGGLGLGMAIAFVSVVFIAFVTWRRAIFRRFEATQLAFLAPKYARPHEERAMGLRQFLGRRYRRAHLWLGGSILVTIVVALAIMPWLSPALPRDLGTPAVVFFWAAAVVPVGSVLAMLGSAWRKPLLVGAALTVMIVSWVQSDLNAPRRLAADGSAASPEHFGPIIGRWAGGNVDPINPATFPGSDRCDFSNVSDRAAPLSRYACAWILAQIDSGGPLVSVTDLSEAPRRQSERIFPVLLVTAEGGGIRAALWPALNLARLEDRHPGFFARTLAMSGASGGSLGIGVVTAMYADDLKCKEDGGTPRAGKSLHDDVGKVLGGDFLAPVVSAYLFTDLVRPFTHSMTRSTGLTWIEGDRVAYLELSWEESYEKIRAQESANCRFNALAENYEKLWSRKDLRLPLLFLNTTQVHDGRRAVFAPGSVYGDLQAEAGHWTRCHWNTRLDGCFLNGLEEGLDARQIIGYEIALSTAIGLSARFPFITSVGNVMWNDRSLRQMADGGYFDNSATITMREIIDSLPASIRLSSSEGKRVRVVPVVLHFINDPTPDPRPPTARSVMTLQSIAPVQTLDTARSARNYFARIVLHERVEQRGGYFVQIALQPPMVASEHDTNGRSNECGAKRARKPPLGWVLSPAINCDIEKQTVDDDGLKIMNECVAWALGAADAKCAPQKRPSFNHLTTGPRGPRTHAAADGLVDQGD